MSKNYICITDLIIPSSTDETLIIERRKSIQKLLNIKIAFTGNETVEGIAKRNEAEILDETLGTTLTIGETLTFSKEWNINGEKVTISVEKV